jgi:glutaredoxin
MQIEIYTKEDCPYCTQAKNWFTSMGYTYTERNLNVDFNREDLLAKFPNAKTFPQIVINGVHTGGWDNTKKHLGIEGLTK